MASKAIPILATFGLMMISVYFYSLFGFYYIDHTYYYPDVGDGERTCTSLW